jgi:hypothetical protein
LSIFWGFVGVHGVSIADRENRKQLLYRKTGKRVSGNLACGCSSRGFSGTGKALPESKVVILFF